MAHVEITQLTLPPWRITPYDVAGAKECLLQERDEIQARKERSGASSNEP